MGFMQVNLIMLMCCQEQAVAKTAEEYPKEYLLRKSFLQRRLWKVPAQAEDDIATAMQEFEGVLEQAEQEDSDPSLTMFRRQVMAANTQEHVLGLDSALRSLKATRRRSENGCDPHRKSLPD